MYRFKSDEAPVLRGGHRYELPSLALVHTQSKNQYIQKTNNKKPDINGGNEKNYMGKLGKNSDNRTLKK